MRRSRVRFFSAGPSFDLASGTSIYVVQQSPLPVENSTWIKIKALGQ